MKKKNLIIIALALIAIAVMSYIETVIRPGYLIKSIVKVVMFSGCILFYCLNNKINIVELLNIKKPKKASSLYIFVGIAYTGIITVFFLLKGYTDLSTIKNSLVIKEGLNKNNCLLIFSYIVLINSFLEESFFRGFIYKALQTEKTTASIISSLFFALYHIGIVDGWFNPFVYALCIAGLMAAGLMLDYVCEKYDSLLASWLVHATANLAINTIGLYLIFCI